MTKKQERIEEQEQIANKVYNDLASHIAAFLEDRGYLEDKDHVISSCYTLVVLAADLMSHATDLENHEIIRELAQVLSDTLGYEVEYQIEGEEEDHTFDLPKLNNKDKNNLN